MHIKFRKMAKQSITLLKSLQAQGEPISMS